MSTSPTTPPQTPSPQTPAPAPAPRRWWRRNRGALLALALLVPASVAGIGVQEWRTNNTEAIVPADTVAAGETVSADGARFGPATIADAVGAEVPAGARAVVATVPVELDSESDSESGSGPDSALDGPVVCGVAALREADGAQRRWNTGASLTGWEPPADGWTTCPSEPDGGAFTVSVVFVVPADAGPFVLDLLVGPESRLVRFELD